MNDTPDEHSDDWLLSGQDQHPAAEPSRRRNLMRAAALVLGGLIVGGGTVVAVQAVADDDESAFAADGHGDGDDQGFDRGVPPGGPPPGAPDGGPGGVPGEIRLQGTLTEVTSDSVTVKTADGSETYELTDTTQIVRDGELVTVDDLKVDDPVLVHVIPSSGGDPVVERIFAGTLPGYDDGDGSDDTT